LGRKRLFEKRISADEMRKKTKEYQIFVLKDIFPEYKLKEYMNKIKNIVQKNGESEEVGGKFTEDGNSWFYTNGRNLHYFLEEDNDFKKDIKVKDTVKKQSCLNLGNSDENNMKCGTSKNNLADCYSLLKVLDLVRAKNDGLYKSAVVITVLSSMLPGL